MSATKSDSSKSKYRRSRREIPKGVSVVSLADSAESYGSSFQRRVKDRRHHQDYPNYFSSQKKWMQKTHTSFDQQLRENMESGKEERPTALRANMVELYVRSILNSETNPKLYKQKLGIVEKMIDLRMDNRILNQMRQTMNENIEDTRGLMSVEDFKTMFFTSFGRSNQGNRNIIYQMLLPLVVEDDDKEAKVVSIAKLSKFIDFFNYVPTMVNKIRHKNATSDDLYAFMGRAQEGNKDYTKNLCPEEKKKIEKEGK